MYVPLFHPQLKYKLCFLHTDFALNFIKTFSQTIKAKFFLKKLAVVEIATG
jgi:hypothetical protein